MNNNQYIRKIEEDLTHLGLKKHEIVLAHINIESLGEIAGGAETLIKGIEQVLGDGGTLLMPTITHNQLDGVEHDEFSAKDTPSECGVVSEIFRNMPNVERSINPTHSVCGRGRFVKEMLGTHQLDGTPCGPHSPYRLLNEIGGQILVMGCELNSNTSIHGVEEMINPDYLFGEAVKYRIFNSKREKSYLNYKRYAFNQVIPRYDRLLDLLEVGKTIKVGKVLDYTCYLIDAKVMWKVAQEKLKENPLYFVDLKED